MKVNFIAIILFAVGFTMLFSLTNLGSENSISSTDVTISVTNLSQDNFQYIKKEFNNLRGILYCDISLASSMVCLRINDNIVSNNNIKTILRKWGCRIKGSSFNKIINLK